MVFNQKEFNEFVIEKNVAGFFEEPITLVSGRKSHFYFNWRNVISDVWLTDKLADFVIDFVKSKNLNVDTFYGVPEGATKLGVVAQFKWSKQKFDFSEGSHTLAMGRAKPKEHGEPKDRFFVGLPKGNVVVIEDVTNTGGSLVKTLDSLINSGVNIIGVISLTNRMMKNDEGMSVKEAVESRGLKFYNMSSAFELLPEMYKKSQPKEEVAIALEHEFEKYGVDRLKLASQNMVDKLLEKIDEKQNHCIVGLDSNFESIPKHLVKGNSMRDIADAIFIFNKSIIDAVHDLVPAVKVQIAFYEKYGSEGVRAFKETVDYARSKGLIVIEDGKRNDIGNTSKAYANAHLGTVETLDSTIPSLDLDLLTVNPYLGSDGLNPFIEVCKEHGKGIFILAKTSNKSSGEYQDRLIKVNTGEKLELERLGVGIGDKTELYNLVALNINKYAQEQIGTRGYSQIGAVVGATYPEQARILRKIMPNSFFLVPGYGAQGGDAKDLINCFNKDGYGAVVNSSRGIIFAYLKKNESGQRIYSDEEFAEAAREATKLMIKNINSALRDAGKLPSKWNIV